jgi:hypothetical protein
VNGSGLLNRRSQVRVLSGVVDSDEMNGDDGQCQETPKALQNKGGTASDTGRSHAPNTPPIVQTDDCNSSANVLPSDKPDDKQSDKRQITDPDLQQVIDVWADLPEAVKTGILAMVNASQPQQ